MDQNQKNPLGYADPKKLLIKFTIPSIISMTATNLYNLADQMFIGWSVGIYGNAATNVAYPLTTVLLSISLLIGIGYGTRYGIELGKGDKKSAQQAVGNSILLMTIAGIALMLITLFFIQPLLNSFGATETVLPYALTYLRITAFGFPFFMFSNTACVLIRMDGSPKYSMFCTLIGCIVNVILDPVLLFGLGMGIEGAAYATVISQITGFLITMCYFFRMKQIKLTKLAFKPDFKGIFHTLSLGINGCITQLSITFIQIVMNNALVIYGAQSIYGQEIPLAAVGIIMKINSIVTGIFIGISQGGQPLYSFNAGAKQYSRVKTVYVYAIRLSLYVSVSAFVIFEVFPKQLLHLFGESSDLFFQFAVPFMRIFLCMTIVNGIQVITTNCLSASAMPWKGTALAILRYIVLLIPLIIILPVFMGIDGLKYTGPIADLIAAIVSIVIIRKTFRKLCIP